MESDINSTARYWDDLVRPHVIEAAQEEVLKAPAVAAALARFAYLAALDAGADSSLAQQVADGVTSLCARPRPSSAPFVVAARQVAQEIRATPLPSWAL